MTQALLLENSSKIKHKLYLNYILRIPGRDIVRIIGKVIQTWMNFPVIRSSLWPDFLQKLNRYSWNLHGWVFQQYGLAHDPLNWNFGKILDEFSRIRVNESATEINDPKLTVHTATTLRHVDVIPNKNNHYNSLVGMRHYTAENTRENLIMALSSAHINWYPLLRWRSF